MFTFQGLPKLNCCTLTLSDTSGMHTCVSCYSIMVLHVAYLLLLYPSVQDSGLGFVKKINLYILLIVSPSLCMTSCMYVCMYVCIFLVPANAPRLV